MEIPNWLSRMLQERRDLMRDAIKCGDDKWAGIYAGQIVCFINALARIDSGRSRDFSSDPVYGRSFNVREYFDNPRVANSNDDLGVQDWSI